MATIEKASDYAREAAENIDSAAAQAAKALGEKGEQFRKAEQKLMKECGSYVSEHPITSVGIGVAVGFVLSRLLNDH